MVHTQAEQRLGAVPAGGGVNAVARTTSVLLLASSLIAFPGATSPSGLFPRHCLASAPAADTLLTSVLTLRQPPPLEPVAPQVIAHGPRGAMRLALTFDACSTREPSHYDTLVTKVLLETGTHATIFLGGKWMEEEQEHTRELASHPQFELANHTFLHPHLKSVSDERIHEELAMTQAVLYTLTGRQATFFRPPYGEYDERCVRIAAEMGLHTIEFDLASGDPDKHATKEKLIEYVTEKARDGSIVVMHINHRGWHTAEALPEIIRKLRARGFELVTVGELLGSP